MVAALTSHSGVIEIEEAEQIAKRISGAGVGFDPAVKVLFKIATALIKDGDKRGWQSLAADGRRPRVRRNGGS